MDKDTQHKLEISEIKYRKLFETAQDGILLFDPLTEKIIDANPFLLDIIGQSLEEVIGKKLWELGPFKDIKASKEAFKKLQSDKYVRYEDLPLKRKDGSSMDVEFVCNDYPIAGEHMIQCNIRDITDRKKAENKAALTLQALEKLNSFMTGREVRMSELKKEIENLKKKLTK